MKIAQLTPEQAEAVRRQLAKGIAPGNIRLPHANEQKKRGMNKLELGWSLELDALKAHGAVRRWDYEVLKLRVGKFGERPRFYVPDFLVVLNSGALEIHECKGWFREDSKEKIAAARDRYGDIFRFVLVTRSNGQFVTTEI